MTPPPPPPHTHTHTHTTIVTKSLAAINTSAASGSPEDTLSALQSDCLEISDVDPSCARRYQEALANAQRQKGAELSPEEIGVVVKEVNDEVKLERLSE